MLRNEAYAKFTPSLMCMKLPFPVSAEQSPVFLTHAVLPSLLLLSLSGSLKDIYNPTRHR